MTKERIELLNGVSWMKEVILREMEKDSFYYGYCSKTMFSSSAIKLMDQSIKKYYFIEQYASSTQALRDGWLFHASILEPKVFEKLHFSKTLTKGVEFKKLVEEYGEGNVFTLDERNKAERMSDAFYKNEKAKSYLIDAEFEKPICGMVDGYPFRGKADVLRENEIIDLKTTRNIKYFKRDAYDKGYDIQCYLYCNLFDISYDNFTFIAIDKMTLDIGFFYGSKNLYNSGKHKVQKALQFYTDKLKGKKEDQIKDFIYNHYYEETL